MANATDDNTASACGILINNVSVQTENVNLEINDGTVHAMTAGETSYDSMICFLEAVHRDYADDFDEIISGLKAGKNATCDVLASLREDDYRGYAWMATSSAGWNEDDEAIYEGDIDLCEDKKISKELQNKIRDYMVENTWYEFDDFWLAYADAVKKAVHGTLSECTSLDGLDTAFETMRERIETLEGQALNRRIKGVISEVIQAEVDSDLEEFNEKGIQA